MVDSPNFKTRVSMIQRFHIPVFAAIWLVIAALLALQLTLNSLKFRGLMVSATSERLQVSAATLENVMIRAEQAGLQPDEIDSFGSLIEREMKGAGIIDSILVVSPTGQTIISAGDKSFDPAFLETLLRRVMSRKDSVMEIEEGGQLYSTRKVLDSTSSVMAILVITAASSVYEGSVSAVHQMLFSGHWRILLIATLILIPLVILGFHGINRVIRVIEIDLHNDGDSTPASGSSAEIVDVKERVNAGKRAYGEVVSELDDIEAIVDLPKALNETKSKS